jgi:hypothetical protein
MSVGYAIVAISWILGSIGLIAVDQPRSRMLPQPSGYVNRVKPINGKPYALERFGAASLPVSSLSPLASGK